MTVNELVDIAKASSVIRALDPRPSDTEIEKFAALVADEVATSFDWPFTLGLATTSTVADQADYTLRGKANDCRDIVNVAYQASGDTGWIVLVEKRPVDMDEFLSGRTVTGTGWWTDAGRDSNGSPQITLINAPISSL